MGTKAAQDYLLLAWIIFFFLISINNFINKMLEKSEKSLGDICEVVFLM